MIFKANKVTHLHKENPAKNTEVISLMALVEGKDMEGSATFGGQGDSSFATSVLCRISSLRSCGLSRAVLVGDS